MATYTIIKLKDMSPLHMGTGKENYDFSASVLHSDTLSSALVAIRVGLGKSTDVYDFMNSFSLSSAFPYMGDKYFLPVPTGKLDIVLKDCEEYVSRKKIKKIRFAEYSVWQNLIEGKQVFTSTSSIQNGFLLPDQINGSFCLPYKSAVNQRVSVPRDENMDASPFFFDWTYFHQNGGLYCITDAKGELLNEIVTLFCILGEVGLGTDKNIGGGKFNIETDSINIAEVANTKTQMLLSLYIPHEEDMSSLSLDKSHYEVIQRGGYIAGSLETDLRHLRKKSVYMLGVGSVLYTEEQLKGKIVDLRPKEYEDSRLHPVYRSGKPFIVPIKTKGYE